MVYTERDLIVPALKVLGDWPDGMNTSKLIKLLMESMKPSGHNGDMIRGRRDTFFSQKVRNLKSHDTLTGMGVATYDNGIWKITQTGVEYLRRTEPIVDSLKRQGIKKEKLSSTYKDYSEIIIEEGALDWREVKQRERSGKLRDIAIAEFKRNNGGKLPCAACGFDFGLLYGSWGEGFIEIHHTDAIHTRDIEGSKTTLKNALRKLVPLCSNCHRMVHRKKGTMLSVMDLKNMIEMGVI